MISVAYKHPNVYIGSDAYAPAHWSPQFVQFIDSWGSKKVIFGTDFPVIDPERARADIEKLDDPAGIEAALPARQRDRAVQSQAAAAPEPAK